MEFTQTSMILTLRFEVDHMVCVCVCDLLVGDARAALTCCVPSMPSAGCLPSYCGPGPVCSGTVLQLYLTTEELQLL